MLQFWCLRPVRVAYHGSFRENLESTFWGFGVSYQNLMKHMQVFKMEQLRCCSFDASPQSEWLITAHLERIWNQHFGAWVCLSTLHLLRSLEPSAEPQVRGKDCWKFWCLSPVRVAYHGSFRENLESAFWGFGALYHSLIQQMQVFKTEQLKCCSFDAFPQLEWLITAHLERIWNQHFGALDCHNTTWLNTCKSSKRSS